MMDNPQVEAPRGIKIVLERIDNKAALGGYATPHEIGFQASSWPREKHRLWILAHELTNLFANHYAGAGGFPSDWWSNGRSPFPIYAAALICEKLEEEEAAKWLRTVDAELDDQKLYWALHEKYGFQLFAKFSNWSASMGWILESWALRSGLLPTSADQSTRLPTYPGLPVKTLLRYSESSESGKNLRIGSNDIRTGRLLNIQCLTRRSMI